MLSDLELKVVEDCKIEGYMGVRSPLYRDYDDIKKEIDKGKIPDQERVSSYHKNVDRLRVSLDIIYLHRLSNEPVNPLILEQEAWSILSEKIKDVQKKFMPHIEKENLQEYQRNITEYLDTIFSLLEKVTVIGRSYGEKYDIAIYRNSPRFADIPYENWFKGIPKKEKAVKDLIEELQKETGE
jgi:hypothetical protein